ncbi:MAG: caspase family protein [Desulfosalsimonadaceae bacterium]
MTCKALLVGVNKYKLPGSDLQGCVNDATNVRDVLLKYFGFNVKDIRVLVDARATKKAILARLIWLVKNVKSGDRILFHFSGHGSQIRDRDGDELKDHLDEILCPHDMDWDGTYIADDELKAIFSTLPAGVHLDVLLDSCHSGSGTRDIQAVSALPETPGLPRTVKQRFLAPPIDILCRQLDEDDLPVTQLLKSTNPENHALFSGCRDNQTSADAYISGTYSGAFTYYFCKHIRDAQGAITRADLLKRLRASLKHEGYDQIPQLECPVAWKKKKVLE